MEIKRAVTNVRAVTLMIIFFVIFFVFIGRVAFIQVTKEVNGQELEELAEERWSRSIELLGKRGTIFDRGGGILAEEVTSYKVYAILNQNQSEFVQDPSETADALAPYINQDVQNLTRILSQDKFQVELGAGARNLTYEEMLEIRELELEGIYFTREPRRYYPKQTYASHIIGYTERNMEAARMGLERSLDDYLSGQDGQLNYQADRNRVPLLNQPETITPAEDGLDVYLTLDSNIQTSLEQVMTEVDEQYKPERMIAIVADPKTGQILAMSNRPSFNPNRYESITNYMNYAVSDHFEPGSTVKMFTVAAAIEEGKFNQDQLYQSGTIQVGPDPVRDHNYGRGWGEITFEEGFYRSSNVAMAKLALEGLGADKLYEYWERFGLTEPTGIDLPNEASSLIAKGSQTDVATTAFGQGTAITPIQQIQAATAIANGGKMMKPYVIDRMVDPNTDDVVMKNEPEVTGEPISEETASQMLDLLEGAVIDPAGTGKPYYIEGFDVVGKTGTAQIPNPNGPGYIQGHGENIFSFLGMAPKKDPSLLVYVAVERPTISAMETGAQPAQKIFTTVMKQGLEYLNVVPTVEEINQETKKGYQLEDFTGMTTKDAAKVIEEQGLTPVILGDGKQVISQEPAIEKGLLKGERVFLRTDDDSYEIPNMVDWSSRDVLRLADVLDITANLFGQGYVTGQDVSEGDRVVPGDYITIELALKSYEQEENLVEEEMNEADTETEDEENGEAIGESESEDLSDGVDTE
ncbi:penicillin-binding protein [Alkalihalobacillus pseudalcaliphilus]|uniref:penicillin-binding protein n=1 Tax=Alkalihalobacillus pseudalcaliphilus TaxID=79884 RepID=UPI00064DB713|nr:penicillin-binding protein [Alkalihalobacillus pseudalcaliphilus]KMK77113.1 penicillin-binding protein [Alkalihalobacillus pseudalcaliphilus]